MQTDMHYYGTYALARAAGLVAPAVQVIANAAEYVDDSDYVDKELNDGAFVHAPPTAHHPENRHNIEPVDQRRVWVPFHFIPGNQGDSLEECLVCQKNSEIAQEMVRFHLGAANQDFILERIGIAAHVYADTFSHYGFSGITSSWNQVRDGSIDLLNVESEDVLDYLTTKAETFIEKYVEGRIADEVALGHGAVATYPDRPFLSWKFTYEHLGRQSGIRENQTTFLEGAEALYNMFRELAHAMPGLATDARPFEGIKAVVAKVLAVQGNIETRKQAWEKAALEGALFGALDGEEIPHYVGGFAEDVEIMRQHNRDSIGGTNGYAFLRAAQSHRDYVLFDLLPKHSMNIVEFL